MAEANQHNDRIIDDEADEDTEKKEAKNDSHLTGVVIREHKKVDADYVGRDLVKHVLVVNYSGLPLPLCEDVGEHHESAYEHYPDSNQRQGRYENYRECVDDSSQCEHERVHNGNIFCMI